jgi:hypothetical protein
MHRLVGLLAEALVKRMSPISGVLQLKLNRKKQQKTVLEHISEQKNIIQKKNVA